jgi:hypothetical protein
MPFTTVRSTIQIGTTLFVTMQSHNNNFEELKIGDTIGHRDAVGVYEHEMREELAKRDVGHAEEDLRTMDW